MAALSGRESVLVAAHAGDPLALEQLLRMCRPDVRRYAQRHCLISDVDDAVQEALLLLARRVHQLRVLAAFSGWLIRIVQRECRRLGRVALRYDPYDEARLEQWLGAHDSNTLRIELAQALQSLPAHYRDVILMRDFEELSIGEMATRLAVTPAAVKSRLHRAREMARDHLLA